MSAAHRLRPDLYRQAKQTNKQTTGANNAEVIGIPDEVEHNPPQDCIHVCFVSLDAAPHCHISHCRPDWLLSIPVQFEDVVPAVGREDEILNKERPLCTPATPLLLMWLF